MGAETPGTLLQAVSELARLTGEVAASYARPGIAVDTKGDGSPVTIADREAERFARAWIAERFPHDAIVGEEFGVTPARGGAAIEASALSARGAGGAARQWILDPIDGTKSFVRGVPLWGTLIAVMEGPDVIAGAAAFPATHELVAAARGEGAWWNGARCAVSSVGSLAEATVLSTGTAFEPGDPRRARWDALGDRAGIVRTWGDCFGYLMVATGRAEVMMDPRLNVWDAASVQVIVEEAGGTFMDWNGVRTPEGLGGIAVNAALAAEVRAALVG
ncbi:MAG: histidinol phosphate phosphatase [Candidatus Eisenbacteria bacterium]|uniref:3'(2'),5'-bisphosphate nucleotidase n=1 Tax=Eiseniibacteriota bacterium TaxID=2212470 RepID=A0A933SE60_UNCEI|nr:histidinol phosphate phosphatase [Candidatus Eisenbacteria bacterium]